MTNNNTLTPLTVSVAVAKSMLGIGHTKIFELLKDNEQLESILIGRKRLILLASIHALVERQRVFRTAPGSIDQTF